MQCCPGQAKVRVVVVGLEGVSDVRLPLPQFDPARTVKCFKVRDCYKTWAIKNALHLRAMPQFIARKIGYFA